MAKRQSTPMTPEVEDAALEAAVSQGLASLEAGHGIPYEDVRRWLLSWGADNELPPPEYP
jgi:predicted transcriptional regulator